ncbi:hypothetical protein [Candidatus Nitrospira inopinata]|uniref:hypothetical protein n=1 Tax=Candidatus Nitrospira inopinata TaxID=1715989 RepID=UPI0007836B4C|nr:hypothetical protein [Candidatus Nitrospira inopinata]
MHNYEHKKLIEAITRLDEVPADSKPFSEWIEAEAHLDFLRKNARADELVIHASGEYTLIHSVAVPNDRLAPVDQQDLMQWSFKPFTSIASYVTGGGCEGVWVERGLSGTGTNTLKNAMQLIFVRTFEGWTGPGRTYHELHQEYAHLTDIHWRPEMRAYCRFNELGDLEPVVSVTSREDKASNMALVSFKWAPLEEYLAASNASLVRMFDFTLLRRSGFSGWSEGPTQEIIESPDFFYRRQVMPSYAAYTRGVQIIRPRRSPEAIFTGITDRWFGRKNKQYVEFIAYDWRNQRVTGISTDPAATTDYFQAKENTLPFELSPAFFGPEVLLKYKADRDKYTVSDRDVSCRAAWHLEAIDVNEAGQVHAYICYLRRLPYKEQLHWLSYNEPPKASISKRAFINDFEGEFVNFVQPLQKVLSIVQRWHDDKVAWWTLRDEMLLKRVNTPLTESRDEWAEVFMDLAKLVIEGFETKVIRTRLDEGQVSYAKEDKTIALLEKLLSKSSTGVGRLAGLRTVQLLRSKAKGHAGGSEAQQLAQNALMEHETFANHFHHVCAQVADELESIEKRMS